MIKAITTIGARFQNLYRNEEGAIAFEYLLVLAGVSVGIIAAVALAMPAFTTAVIAGTCGAINTLATVTMVCP